MLQNVHCRIWYTEVVRPCLLYSKLIFFSVYMQYYMNYFSDLVARKLFAKVTHGSFQEIMQIKRTYGKILTNCPDLNVDSLPYDVIIITLPIFRND